MSTPTPDYGEPWVDNRHLRGSVMTREHNPVIDNTGLMKRALLCVNACAGIPDPAAHLANLNKELAELREWKRQQLEVEIILVI